MATWVAGALGGVDPSIMGVGPVAAVKKVLAKTGMSIDEFDLIRFKQIIIGESIKTVIAIENGTLAFFVFF